MLIIAPHFTRVDAPRGRVNDATVRVATRTYIRHTWSRRALDRVIGRRERRNENVARYEKPGSREPRDIAAGRRAISLDTDCVYAV